MGEQLSTLDHTFSALAHPTRRSMLEVLVREPIRVTDLAAQFDCSLNVASKHILSLERAGLVRREQKGREHWLRLEAAPLSDAAAFVQRYRRFWEQQMDRLGTYLDSMAESPKASRATKSKKA
jgi:DNA-binding transcriptional ArsR family regulator